MNSERIKVLLSSVHELLLRQDEHNWLRGIAAAIETLDAEGGVKQARLIYESMSKGVGSFADYNIWINDFDARAQANKSLDNLREQLWDAFEL